MSDQPKTCPKCKQPMELGFVLEQNLSNYCPSVWVEGSPEPLLLDRHQGQWQDQAGRRDAPVRRVRIPGVLRHSRVGRCQTRVAGTVNPSHL